MILRIHGWEIIRAQDHPLPWWSDTPRAWFGRVITGEPAMELDENGEPTGWYLMAHPDIGEWDLFMLDLWRAGWGYVDTLPEGVGGDLVALQHERDWANFEGLVERVHAGEISKADAYEQVKAELRRQAGTLGLVAPSDEPLVDVEASIQAESPLP